MNNWQEIKIADLGKVVTGKTPPTERKELFGNKYPFITPSDLEYETYYPKTERYLSELGKEFQQSILLPPETVCFTSIGATIGKSCLTNTYCFTNQQINSIVVDKINHNAKFIYYLLKTKIESIKGIAGGAATPIVNKSKFEGFKIDVPSFPIQQKIASILSAYDDLIENNNRRIQILEEMAQRIYREWFVHFRFPGHENVKMVESELGMIPEGWDTKSLSELTLRITDGSHYSPPTVDSGYPMASVKDMHNWGFYVDRCRKISKMEYSKLIKNDCKPLKNDILIAKDGSYLKHVFVMDEDKELVILSSIAILRPNKLIFPNFLTLLLQDSTTKSRLKGFVSGAALPRIILKDFRKFLVLLPPYEIQKHFNKIIESMFNQCYNLIKKNQTLSQTRDLLLPKLISGKIDVEELVINGG